MEISHREQGVLMRRLSWQEEWSISILEKSDMRVPHLLTDPDRQQWNGLVRGLLKLLPLLGYSMESGRVRVQGLAEIGQGLSPDSSMNMSAKV